MVKPIDLFGNFLEGERISPLQLHNFASDVFIRLKNANGTGDYNALINLLTVAVDNFYLGLSRAAGNDPQVKIQLLDNLTASFKSSMKENIYYIADALGGFRSSGYRSFYPNGINEYINAGKTQAAFLMKRVDKEAAIYKQKLGEELFSNLARFETQWQEALKFLLADQIVPFKPELEALESTLLMIIHAIGQKFPGNLLMCMSFFNFSLLFRR